VPVPVVPSPKFHEREAIVPSLSVDVSVNVAVRSVLLVVKLATGAALPPPPPPPAVMPPM